MKPLAALALCLVSSLAFAQAPLPKSGRIIPPNHAIQPCGPRPSDAINDPDLLPENYVLKVAVSDKDHLIGEFSMVVLKRNFKFTTFDPFLTMSGDLFVEEQGTVICQYSINASVPVPVAPQGSNSPVQPGVSTGPVEYRQTEADTCVRLRLGAPTQVLKAGGRTYEMTISKQAEAANKSK